MIPRLLRASIARSLNNDRKSVMLLGPRQVGKSTLAHSLAPDLALNLADEETLLDLSQDPGALRSAIETAGAKRILIDEVQRSPSLLNTIQALIDERKGRQFILTGSSSRKLKRSGANLLPGRLIEHRLGPLVPSELGTAFDIERSLVVGLLPGVTLSQSKASALRLLKSYVGTYLKEEIKAEALTRSLDAFSRFLAIAAESAGQHTDYSKVARLARIPRHLVSAYLEVLEDTLVAQRVGADRELAERADLVKHPKVYFFDTGVWGSLAGQGTESGRRGAAMENLVYQCIVASAQNRDIDLSISTFRTRGGLEADFAVRIEKSWWAIEVKSARRCIESDAAAVARVANLLPGKKARALVIYTGPKPQKLGDVWALPLEKALSEMGL